MSSPQYTPVDAESQQCCCVTVWDNFADGFCDAFKQCGKVAACLLFLSIIVIVLYFVLSHYYS